jgi:hypothetical protein
MKWQTIEGRVSGIPVKRLIDTPALTIEEA